MVRDSGGRGLLTMVAAAAVCSGAAVLLVTAGVLSVGGGLLGSPELTVAAVVVGLVALWRVVVALVRDEELMWCRSDRSVIPWPYERPARCGPGRPESKPNGDRDT